MRAAWHRRAAAAVAVMVTVIASSTQVTAGSRLWTRDGVADFIYSPQAGAIGGPPTGYRPESKLFFTPDRRWWGVFADRAGDVSLFQQVDHRWTRRLRLPGSDPWMKADALFHRKSRTLYVALRDNGSTQTNPRRSLLYRLDYQRRGWRLRSSPSLITTDNPETLTLARDSNRRLWVTFETGGLIRVGFTRPGGTRFRFKTLASGVASDDISTLIAYDERIGVMWSNQNTGVFRFASRRDETGPATDKQAGFGRSRVAYGNGVGQCPRNDACADDHISLRARGGRLYAAVKTSLNDATSPSGGDPLVVLLRRGSRGSWSAFEVADVAAGNVTQPILLLAPGLDALYVFATRSGVKVWRSALTSPNFSGPPVQWTSMGTNYATSTKQLIAPSTGAVVVTSNPKTREYWHNEFLPSN